VSLPLPASMPMTTQSNASIQDKMLKLKAYSAYFYHNGGWWTRCSAQVWNEVCLQYSWFDKPSADIVDQCKVEDFDKIGKIWLQVCAEVREEFEQGLLKGDEE
jgi:hypothetical protein